MVLGLTRLQIITQGLALAGRPDLLTDARLWLSMFLEDVYMNQDLEWLEKYKTGIPVVNGTDIPLDYRAAKSGILIHPNTTTTQIRFLTKSEEIDEKIMQSGNALGAPKYCYVDQMNRTFNFITQPNGAYSMNLRYYSIPEIGDFDTALCDDDVPSWGMPFSILVDHIKSRAMEYNDDQRQVGADQVVRNKFAEAKMNNHDRRAGPSRMQLGKRFKKRW